MGDFNNVKSATPAYVWKRGTCRWFCSQQFYYGEMERLAAAAGGNTILSIMRGNDGGPLFLGCEVVFVQVMPALRTANSQIVCYFGDPYLSSTLGDRKQLAIATSSEIGFASDQLAVRGITRLDINNHDVGGNNAATLAQNPAYDQTGGTYYGGPLVALQTYNS
jgi:HK97 family phage major capsid protein